MQHWVTTQRLCFQIEEIEFNLYSVVSRHGLKQAV